MIVFSSVKYLTSAVNSAQWPVSELSEVLLVGKSNVGKSSLINSIFNNKKLAYVGKTPGKTRMLNFFEVADKFMLVDAPGYGFANRSYSEIKAFGSLMDDYLSKRSNLKLIIWILDIRRVPSEEDFTMLEWITHSDIPFKIILNKADKLSNNQKNNQIASISKTLNLDKSEFIVYSTINHLGRDILLDILANL